MQALAVTQTDFQFPGETGFYKGKVRDVYTLHDEYIVMIATDRISAFDVVLPKGIAYKGQVLNQIAAKLMSETTHIVPNWIIAVPDPVVTIGHKCNPFPVEMVVRGFLAGHAWREYRQGKREICGVKLPDGLRENDRFPSPIITPTTKAKVGHDEDITRDEIIRTNLVSEFEYTQLENYAIELFHHGSKVAEEKGLLLVDTKYEFGTNKSGTIVLIDEIHTPDSSRYFYADGYAERQKSGVGQKQLSKEFVREWLIENGFQGLEGQTIPVITPEFAMQVSERYIELFEKITGEAFVRHDTSQLHDRIYNSVTAFQESKLSLSTTTTHQV